MSEPIKIGLHKNQLEIYKDPHRFKIINCGRQFGKTTLVAFVGAIRAMSLSNATGYVVSVDASRSKILFDAILKNIPAKYIAEISAKWMNFTLTNGTILWCKSAESPKSLPGSQLDFLFIDEAALCDEETWFILQPALMRNPNSEVWMISTPRGQNWFYDAFQMEHEDPDYKSFSFTSYDNPTITKKEIDRLAKTLPQDMYEQEIMAKFIKGGLVFRNLDRMMNDKTTFADPIPGHNYVMGVDLAKENDFNVIKVFDSGNNTEVHFIRNNKLDYSYQKSSIYMEAKRWNDATVIIDKTGVGGSVVEDLMKMDRAYEGAPKLGYLTVVPVVFSTVSKPELYNHYLLMSENDMIHLIPDETCRKEHEQFQREKMPSGYFRYSAPKHKFDDQVCAAALACWGLEQIMAGNVIGMSEGIGTTSAIETKYSDQQPVTEWEGGADDGAGLGKAHTLRTLRAMGE